MVKTLFGISCLIKIDGFSYIYLLELGCKKNLYSTIKTQKISVSTGILL